ncbi:MAG: protein-(glutamine-N5) methyltransferase, release factor-specific [Legionellales bacterium]|nr:protein-(glutamine-N5) methyltransferase, release factor-specific [Legionellales bacterium]|tara:strand:+ start:1085 stop:1912 length:828 start_codon:yes stop_codon:yes gene_type:complete
MNSKTNKSDLSAWIVRSRQALLDRGVSNPQQEIHWLLQSVGIPTNFHPAQPSQLGQLNQRLARRLEGEPLAYILGNWSFMDLNLWVNQHVLIPRPETESMVEHILNHHSNHPLTVLELGIGSGAISCALACARPHWQITACDISKEALNVAKTNINNLELEHQINLVYSHWFDEIDGQFDLIVTNPPYLSLVEYEERSALLWEPKSALVSQENGIACYQEILLNCRQFLKKGGTCYMEHGHQQFDAIKDIVLQHAFSRADAGFDLSGKKRFIYFK